MSQSPPAVPVVRAKNPAQTFLLALGVLWMIGGSCAFFSFSRCGIGADVRSDCTVRGSGEATCTFTNLGWAPGAQCVRVGVVRSRDQARLGNGVACTGRLEPKDSRVVEVSVLDGSLGPMEFCAPGGGSWVEACDVFTEPVR